VQSGVSGGSDAVLAGWISMFDEVDVSATRWLGQLVVERQLEDPHDATLLWSHTYREAEPLSEQSPHGLAVALSAAVQRIVQASAPEVARVMRARPGSAPPR
jgi:hypothetical protein